jgi:hypothetical protein
VFGGGGGGALDVGAVITDANVGAVITDATVAEELQQRRELRRGGGARGARAARREDRACARYRFGRGQIGTAVAAAAGEQQSGVRRDAPERDAACPISTG